MLATLFQVSSAILSNHILSTSKSTSLYSSMNTSGYSSLSLDFFILVAFLLYQVGSFTFISSCSSSSDSSITLLNRVIYF